MPITTSLSRSTAGRPLPSHTSSRAGTNAGWARRYVSSVRSVVDGLPYPIVFATDAPDVLPTLLGDDVKTIVVVYDENVRTRASAISRAAKAAGLRVLRPLALAGVERAKTM